MRRLRPRAVVLLGLTIYQQIFRREATPGAGAKPQTFGGAPLFVLPNPSGLNASFPGFNRSWCGSRRCATGSARSTRRRVAVLARQRHELGGVRAIRRRAAETV